MGLLVSLLWIVIGIVFLTSKIVTEKPGCISSIIAYLFKILTLFGISVIILYVCMKIADAAFQDISMGFVIAAFIGVILFCIFPKQIMWMCGYEDPKKDILLKRYVEEYREITSYWVPSEDDFIETFKILYRKSPGIVNIEDEYMVYKMVVNHWQRGKAKELASVRIEEEFKWGQRVETEE